MNGMGSSRYRFAIALVSGSMIAVALPAILASPASAATQTITITKAGFVPMDQSITTGDTVAFTNADTVVHQVLFKLTTGFTCTATPLVVQPAKTQSCTWTAAGTYTYSDPNQQDKNFRGTVTVKAVAPVVVPTVSLVSSAEVVNYGAQVTLSGKIVPSTAGVTVDILEEPSGDVAFTKVTSVATTNGGAFTIAVTPEIGTSYRAEFLSGTHRVASSAALVSVRPAVGLAFRSSKGIYARFTVKVTASTSFGGSYVRIQRKNSLGGWTTLKRVTLGTFSQARLTVALPRGTSRIRAFLPASQAGTGYLSSSSRTVILSR